MNKPMWSTVLLLILATTGCSISGGSIQDDMLVLANILEPEVDIYEQQSDSPDAARNVTVARGVVALLRTGAEPSASIDQIRELRPIFVAWLQSRGKDPEEIENILRPIRVALAILEARLKRA